MSTSQSHSRHLLAVDGLHIHYRSAGAKNAPKVMLLHQAPQNSRGMLDLMQALSDEFHVIAPDMPGFGMSDPLAGETPEIADYAKVLLAFTCQVGFANCSVYGLHTGAAIAVAMGALAPFTKLALDGVPKFSDEERQEMLDNFFPDFSPVEDGSHLARLWARMCDQFVYFPWFKRSNPIPRKIIVSAARIQTAVDDVLITGGTCWLGYRAAMRFDAEAALHQIQGAATLLFRQEDLIAHHQSRFGKLPDNINVVSFPTTQHMTQIRAGLRA
jgi:pimeloyl-ACP methyl ester carboxylesterase